MNQILLILDFLGIVVFAISGTLAAGRKQMDLFGVVVLATVTALGGGTIRDILISSGPIFWITEPDYLLVATSAAILTFFFVRFFRIPGVMMLIADAIGLAIFTVLGFEKAMSFGLSGFIWEVTAPLAGRTLIFSADSWS